MPDDQRVFPTPLFQQSWWLDAVAPGRWHEATVEQKGEVRARLRYVMEKRFGLTVISMPPLTQHAGPQLAITADKPAKRISQEVRLLEGLIEALPASDVLNLNLSPEHTNWLPFYWNGFDQTTRYTYRLSSLGDEEALWAGLRDNIRRDIRKAQKKVEVHEDRGIEAFLKVQEKTFARQGGSFPYDEDVVCRLDTALGERDQRRIFFCIDASDQVHAAVYLVWDEDTAYYLMGGNDPDLRSSGAMSLAMWAAIQHAATRSRVFDFEGSMLRHVERFFRAFGATQTPYHNVSRSSRRFRVLRNLRHVATLGSSPQR